MSEHTKWFDRQFAFDETAAPLATVVERLRGTPGRLQERTAGVSREWLTMKNQERWSIQEHVGHLGDLESLWNDRAQQLLAGARELAPADLTNQRTHAAAHNDRDLATLLDEFARARSELVAILLSAGPDATAHSAFHPRLRQEMRLVDHARFVAEHDDHHLAAISALKVGAPMPPGPSPDTRYPIPGITRTGFLKPFITRPNIIVGDYTYYDDPRGPEHFESNVLYHFDFNHDRLIIGRYCSIASEVRFIMNGGNHPTTWLTTYPFPIFGQGWEPALPPTWPNRGDTVVGNDVWIGYGATIMPGIRVGDGAIIATATVVTKDVPPYAIVGGNPGTILRYRFDEATIARLLSIGWWNWDAATVTQHVAALCSGDVDALPGGREPQDRDPVELVTRLDAKAPARAVDTPR